MRLVAPLDQILHGRSHVRVLRALHHLPAGLPASAREIARRAGISHPTASKILASLAEQGLVARARAARATAFELRRSHTATERLAALFEWEDRLLQELVSFLRDELLRHAPNSVTAAYLFGSAADGGMTATSDIDVAVLHTASQTESVRVAMEEIGEHVRERFGNPLSFLLASTPRKGSRLWRQILQEGIPILEPPAELRE